MAVVVVTRDSAGFIRGCLASVRDLRTPPAEVVVVDSGSSDGTPSIVRNEFPGYDVLECAANVGFCRGNNLGIARTTSPFVLALNPDTKLTPAFVEELLPAFDEPLVGIAAGKLLRFDGVTLDSAGQLLGRSRRPVDRGYGGADRGQFERDEIVFGACAAAALYRRAMLDELADPGGEIFDERFFAFYEDLDLAWRARRLGWKAVYRHRAVGYHARGGTASRETVRRPGRALLARDRDLRYHIVKNRYLTILRNDTAAAYLRDLPFILARDLATLGLIVTTSPALLPRLVRDRKIFHGALERRRLDSLRPRHHNQPGTKEGPD